MIDQQIRAESHQLPKDEHHEQIVREDDADHGEHEDGQTTEEAGLVLIVVHVTQ